MTTAIPLPADVNTIDRMTEPEFKERPKAANPSLTGEETTGTKPPKSIQFRNDVAQFHRMVGRERDAARAEIVRKIRTADDPDEFILTTIFTLISSTRPGRLDDAIDVLSECGRRLSQFVVSILTQPQAKAIDEDFWYVLIRAVGRSGIPSARMFVELLWRESPEAAVEALGDIGDEDAIRRLRAVAGDASLGSVRQLAADIIDERFE
jgi:hypothetical protein